MGLLYAEVTETELFDQRFSLLKGLVRGNPVMVDQQILEGDAELGWQGQGGMPVSRQSHLRQQGNRVKREHRRPLESVERFGDLHQLFEFHFLLDGGFIEGLPVAGILLHGFQLHAGGDQKHRGALGRHLAV